MAKNLYPGMDEEQAARDRGGWNTTVEMVTGGVKKDAFEGGSCEVGNPFDEDVMGEEYKDTCYESGDGMPSGSLGKGGKAVGGNKT